MLPQFPSMDPLSLHHVPLLSTLRRGSTSQTCLHRILTTITTVSPPPSTATCSASVINSPQPRESLSSSSSAGCGADDDRARRNLSLLIEAAQLIFGDFVDGDEAERNGFQLNNAVAPGIGEESAPSPAIRSKRERTRILPCRYRDSVLEPFTRFSRTGSSPKRRRR